jgi:hypothetical protein
MKASSDLKVGLANITLLYTWTRRGHTDEDGAADDATGDRCDARRYNVDDDSDQSKDPTKPHHR